MNICYSEYVLQPVTASHPHMFLKPRKGALLQFRFEEGSTGYADCHPWEELGDGSLQQQLALLKKGEQTPLTSQSYFFAKRDAQARSQKKSLFEGLTIPKSHYLISSLFLKTDAILQTAMDKGFTHFKIKLGRSISQELPLLLTLLKETAALPIRFSLDFNHALNPDAFHSFLKALAPFQQRIDFIEDPFPYEPVLWEDFQTRYGISLACDRQSQAALAHPRSAAVVVIKPAIQKETLFSKATTPFKFVVTSYLDHPLGQLAAAYTAARLSSSLKDLPCGLVSHLSYEPNRFSEAFSQGPQLSVPPGTGWGFDEILSALDWKELK